MKVNENIKVRKEQPDNVFAVRGINVKAFKQDAEADLVDNLRKADCEIISLVAVIDDKIVGHIMFSPVEITYDNKTVIGMGLAPMAVLPEFQKQGIGTALIKEGIDEVKQKGYLLIAVLGHPDYYPRFGFVQASKYNLKSEYEVPDGVFMVLTFQELKVNNGLIKYRPEFNGL